MEEEEQVSSGEKSQLQLVTQHDLNGNYMRSLEYPPRACLGLEVGSGLPHSQ